ncbi:hypothetical protein [Nostoc sp.]|uniref:hypothetical protein n=1 Tax=Nostoc sp. TaxID=1180 RepID=UPI002FF4DEF8
MRGHKGKRKKAIVLWRFLQAIAFLTNRRGAEKAEEEEGDRSHCGIHILLLLLQPSH